MQIIQKRGVDLSLFAPLKRVKMDVFLLVFTLEKQLKIACFGLLFCLDFAKKEDPHGGESVGVSAIF